MSGTTEHAAIRPFRVDVLKDELADLRRRLAETRWPERETVTDESEGRAACDYAGARYCGSEDDFPPGKSRSSSQKKFERRSGRCGR